MQFIVSLPPSVNLRALPCPFQRFTADCTVASLLKLQLQEDTRGRVPFLARRISELASNSSLFW